MEIGPQNPKDEPFTARMRFHQSWYRANVLKVPPGVGPRPSNKTLLGSMLTGADGQGRGLNFLAPHIFTVAKRRAAEKRGLVDAFRLECNMLSGEALAFNLFALMVDHKEMAGRLLSALFPGEVAIVNKLALAWRPFPPQEYLNDGTGFDFWIEYRRPDRKRGAIGIETRVVTQLAEKTVLRPDYRQLIEQQDTPSREDTGTVWLPGALDGLLDPQLNPLIRGRLLAQTVLQHPERNFEHARFVLIHHPEDSATLQAVEKVRALAKGPGEPLFQAISLGEVLERWQSAANEHDRPWLEALRLRYVDFSASQPDWDAAHQGSATT